MENGLLINYKGSPLIVISIHQMEFASVNQILDSYSNYIGIDRKHLTGSFISMIDITKPLNGVGRMLPYAEGEWP